MDRNGKTGAGMGSVFDAQMERAGKIKKSLDDYNFDGLCSKKSP